VKDETLQKLLGAENFIILTGSNINLYQSPREIDTIVMVITGKKDSSGKYRYAQVYFEDFANKMLYKGGLCERIDIDVKVKLDFVRANITRIWRDGKFKLTDLGVSSLRIHENYEVS